MSLTAKERRALELEIERQYAQFQKEHENDLVILVLYVLHRQLGFGAKRLKKFYTAFDQEFQSLMDHYQMPGEHVWLAKKALKDIGVDVEEWMKESPTL